MSKIFCEVGKKLIKSCKVYIFYFSYIILKITVDNCHIIRLVLVEIFFYTKDYHVKNSILTFLFEFWHRHQFLFEINVVSY